MYKRQAEDHTDLYVRMNKVAPLLKRCAEENAPGDYWVDEKGHQILMTEEGHEHAEELLASAGLLPDGGSLYDASNILMIHHLNAALRAHNLFLRDQQYLSLIHIFLASVAARRRADKRSGARAEPAQCAPNAGERIDPA